MPSCTILWVISESMRSPANSTTPVRLYNPKIPLMVLDLPTPLRPRRAVIPVAGTSNETSSTTCCFATETCILLTFRITSLKVTLLNKRSVRLGYLQFLAEYLRPKVCRGALPPRGLQARAQHPCGAQPAIQCFLYCG